MNEDFEEEDLINEEFNSALSQLNSVKARCDAAKIEFSDESVVDLDDIDIKINFPNGRDTRRLWIMNK